MMKIPDSVPAGCLVEPLQNLGFDPSKVLSIEFFPRYIRARVMVTDPTTQRPIATATEFASSLVIIPVVGSEQA